MGFLLCFFYLCVADYIYFKAKHTKPNGPPVWYFFPFVGILPFYCLPKSLFKPIFSFYLKYFPDVIVTRFFYPCVLVKNSAVQDVQSSDQCLSRPGHGFEGVISALTTGKTKWYLTDHNHKSVRWQSIRKTNILALNVLPKAQKFNKTAEVVDNFLKTVEDHEGKLWNYSDELAFAKFQESSNVNLGKTFEVNNIQSFVNSVQAMSTRLSYFMAITLFIPLRIIVMFESFLPPAFRPTFVRKIYAKLTRRLVEERKVPIDVPRDFVEAALHVKEPEIALDFLRDTMFFNMLATTHTTQHTTMATLSYVSLDTRVQQKIHEELDRVVGTAKLSPDHLSNLNYLKAAIHEAYRMTPPVPTMLRWTTAPAQIGGYTVESEMRIGMFLISETVDTKNFPDPDVFNPDRYINNDGKFEASKHFNIFSRGKRMCPGSDIAGMSAQVYCAKILQHFEANPKRLDIEVPRYSGGVLTDPPIIPLRFVRRPGAPVIEPVVLESGLTALVKQVVEGELTGL